jgi:hypothetical protein
MSGSVRLALTLLAAVFAVYVLWHIAIAIVAKLIAVLIPLAFAAVVIVAIIYVVNRKALGPGSRRILP